MKPSKEEISDIKGILASEEVGSLKFRIKFRIKSLFCIHDWEYSSSAFWGDNIRQCKKCNLMELQQDTKKKW